MAEEGLLYVPMLVKRGVGLSLYRGLDPHPHTVFRVTQKKTQNHCK